TPENPIIPHSTASPIRMRQTRVVVCTCVATFPPVIMVYAYDGDIPLSSAVERACCSESHDQRPTIGPSSLGHILIRTAAVAYESLRGAAVAGARRAPPRAQPQPSRRRSPPSCVQGCGYAHTPD